jgi:hypothetical protein
MQYFPRVNTRYTIETVKQVVNFLNQRSCHQVLTRAPSWNNIEKEINGLPYMTGYHIYLDWKITYFTLLGAAVIRDV